MKFLVKLSVLYMEPCVQLFSQDLERKKSTAVGVRASCYPPRAARRRGAAVPVLVGKIAARELHLQLNRA